MFFLISLSHFSSHPLSFSPHFLLSLCISLLLFGALNVWAKKKEVSSPPSSSQMCGYPISFFFFYSLILFMTSSLTWLNVSHGIHAIHVAQCEPFLFMPSVTLLRCLVASSYLVICHPTSYASKNVKSRPPRNPTKFEMVTKFRETISTKKSVSSSEI